MFRPYPYYVALIKPAGFMCWKLSNAQLFAVRQLRQMAYAVLVRQEQHQQGGSILMFGKYKMFTGIIEAVGEIKQISQKTNALGLHITPGKLDMSDVKIGDSIAVNGVCLTVTSLANTFFTVDVSDETLSCTHGLNIVGNYVNLEKAMRLTDRLGGHLVSGHVDGVGTVTTFEQAGENYLLAIKSPVSLLKYIAAKGSITVNGVSLTINRIEDDILEINLIPHTLAETNLKHLKRDERLNLESDMLARYVARLMELSSGVIVK